MLVTCLWLAVHVKGYVVHVSGMSRDVVLNATHVTALMGMLGHFDLRYPCAILYNSLDFFLKLRKTASITIRLG